jgi:uncharacterized protein YlxW (UPF0749 family)
VSRRQPGHRKRRTATTRGRSLGNRWIYSLTGICFLCGGLIAMQVRAFQSVRQARQDNNAATVLMKQQAERNQRQAQKARHETEVAKKQLKALQVQLASSGNISRKQLGELNSQIKKLQIAAGLTTLSGPGIRLVMNDNPSAADSCNGSPFCPGVVHDFDLLQVVNELRLAGAESHRRERHTHHSLYADSLRGLADSHQLDTANSTVYYRAIGDPSTLYSALNMPSGILMNLKNPQAGAPLAIKMSKANQLTLPAATGAAPQFKNAKIG